MPINSVSNNDNGARAQAAADAARAEADSRRVEAENRQAAQQQQEASRGSGVNLTA